jgi:hypothetical protein
VAARLLHTPPPPRKSRQTKGSATTYSPIPFLAGGENNVTCQSNKIATTVCFQFFLSQFSDFCFSLGSSFSFRFLSFSVSGARHCDQRAAGEWVFVAPVQLVVVGEIWRAGTLEVDVHGG